MGRLAILLMGAVLVSPPVPAVVGADTGSVRSIRSQQADTLDRLLRSLEEEDPTPMGRLRVLYHRAVLDEAGIVEADRTLSELHAREPEGMSVPPVLEAYAGALDVLRSRYGRWPPGRIRDLRSGMGRLDDAVERDPDDLEIRYLRLASESHLPGIFRRDEVVRADRRVLRRLRGTDASMPPSMVALIEAFLTTLDR
jgi:hypothetical protein